MLSRAADNLFWLARYLERADYIARVIDATRRLSALPRAYGGAGSEWESALETAGAADHFHERNKEVKAGESGAVEFLVFDVENPSSIRNCIDLARTNARAVRTALTMEMWEGINSAWLELKRFEERRDKSCVMDLEELGRFLGFVKQTSLHFDGSSNRTMLRNDAYWFSRLGLYVERADNTARILDVKYHVLLPESETVGGSLDYFQWTAILRAVSAHTSYHWVYRQGIQPWLVADLLILRPEMPRSLASCYENIVRHLDSLGLSHGRQGVSQRQARAMLGRLENEKIETIFQSGLHEFILAFIQDNTRLGTAIAEQYLT
jgi:uncharacterized alpha-E superfamily protein